MTFLEAGLLGGLIAAVCCIILLLEHIASKD